MGRKQNCSLLVKRRGEEKYSLTTACEKKLKRFSNLSGAKRGGRELLQIEATRSDFLLLYGWEGSRKGEREKGEVSISFLNLPLRCPAGGGEKETVFLFSRLYGERKRGGERGGLFKFSK